MNRLLDRLFLAMHLDRAGITWDDEGADYAPIPGARRPPSGPKPPKPEPSPRPWPEPGPMPGPPWPGPRAPRAGAGITWA